MPRAPTVTHTLTFLLGCIVVAALMLWREKARQAAVVHAKPPARPAENELPEIAIGVGAELATLASGIGGTAQLLCETLSAGGRSTQHAEQLCTAVRRLRTLSETIQFAVGPVEVRARPTRIDDVVASVQHELSSAGCGRFQVDVDLASSVPEVQTDPRALRQTLLLLVEVLFGREPGTSKITLRTRNAIDESAHAVVLEMIAEVEETVATRALPAARLTLAHQATTNLLAALGAEWTLHVVEREQAMACIALPSADVAEALLPSLDTGTQESARAPGSGPGHAFGGALVLESNPAVRYMVGQELERTGRQVFLCADGLAARTLWQATPSRFELLVVEAQGEYGPGEDLLVEVLTSQPNTRAILLGRTELPSLTKALACPTARVASIPQPFDLMELRDALAHVGIEPARVAS